MNSRAPNNQIKIGHSKLSTFKAVDPNSIRRYWPKANIRYASITLTQMFYNDLNQ